MAAKKVFWTHPDSFTEDELSNATVMMVLGATGCGKTTLVNAMFNYHWGV